MRVILKPAGLTILSVTLLLLVGIVALDRWHVRAIEDEADKAALMGSGKSEAANGTNATNDNGVPDSDMLSPTADKTAVVWRYTTTAPSEDWNHSDFDDTNWSSGKAGFGHDQTGQIGTTWTTSDIWMRRKVSIPKPLSAEPAIRIFHDEDAEVYTNGVLAANAPAYSSTYVSLPMAKRAFAALKPGAQNVIAVHCHNAVGGQYIDVGF